MTPITALRARPALFFAGSALLGSAALAASAQIALPMWPVPATMQTLVVLLLGALLAVTEEHRHAHVHSALTHEHRHTHDDEHHRHSHEGETQEEHSHMHTHEELEHTHPHHPDAHHRHGHG